MSVYCPMCEGTRHESLGLLGELQYLRCCACHAIFETDAESEIFPSFGEDDEP